jgi:hypothetical protein
MLFGYLFMGINMYFSFCVHFIFHKLEYTTCQIVFDFFLNHNYFIRKKKKKKHVMSYD